MKISAALQVPLFPPPPYLPHSSSDSNAAQLLPGCPGNCHPEISVVFTVNITEGGDEVCSEGVPRTTLYTQSVMGGCDPSSHHRQSVLAVNTFPFCL